MPAASRAANVLLITIDDLRPQLGCYGDPVVRSPHIDKLAAGGVVFERAYCQQALCSPSRTSLLTGLRPDTTRVYDIETHFRKHLPDAVTLPQLFKNSGYHAQGLYKVFHMAGFDPAIGNLDDPPSWTKPTYLPKKSVYGPEGAARLAQAYERLRAAGKRPSYRDLPRSLAAEAPDIGDAELSDGEVAREAVRALRQLRDQKFFLAVGFYKPHLPFVAPKAYWDLYRESDLRLAENEFPPHGAPPWSVPPLRELRSYADVPDEGPLPEALKRHLLHGYLACVSYVDAQVGLVLDELARLGLDQTTTVILLGDHGYQLGEHGAWASKHSNFETSTRAPLIVRTPGMKAAGAKSRALVEFVDVYPTLAEIAGLRAPEHLEGVSFRPLLDEPRRAWKKAAFSQYPRNSLMGRTLTDGRFRYTEWLHSDGTLEAAELYDHSADPQENVNRAADPALSAHRARLRDMLHSGWRAARP